MMKRQQNTIRYRIEDKLFPAVQKEIEDSLSRLFESTFNDLRDKLKHILHLVWNAVAVALAAPSEYQRVGTHADSFLFRVKELLAEYEHIAEQIGAAQ